MRDRVEAELKEQLSEELEKDLRQQLKEQFKNEPKHALSVIAVHRTRAVSGRGERMRASGPLDCEVRRPAKNCADVRTGHAAGRPSST